MRPLPRHVQLGVSVPFEPGDGRIGEVGEIVARPELAAVGVAGKLEVDAVLDCVMDDDGLMREKHGRAGAVPVAERLAEIGAVALALARDVVDTGEIERADLDALVLEGLSPSSRTWSTHASAPEKYSWFPVTKKDP